MIGTHSPLFAADRMGNIYILLMYHDRISLETADMGQGK